MQDAWSAPGILFIPSYGLFRAGVEGYKSSQDRCIEGMLSMIPRCESRRTVPLLLALVATIVGLILPDYCLSASPPVSYPRWVQTGNLNVATRSWHTATLLTNGKVLVVGGEDDNGASPSGAELYDPSTGTWSVTGQLNAAHAYPTATLLPDGRVLIVGGVYANGYLISDSPYNAELYDPAKGTWSASSGAPFRFGHTATLLQTGKVLIVGGNGTWGIFATALYDPATDTWSRTGNINAPQRFGHQATLLQDGRVLIVGGLLGADLVVADASVELYDPVTGKWTFTSPLHTSRSGHTATRLSDGRVLSRAAPAPAEQRPFRTMD